MSKKFYLNDLENLKREELYQLAQELNVKGRSKMTKLQLLQALEPFAEKSKDGGSNKSDGKVPAKDKKNEKKPAEKKAKNASSAKKAEKAQPKAVQGRLPQETKPGSAKAEKGAGKKAAVTEKKQPAAKKEKAEEKIEKKLAKKTKETKTPARKASKSALKEVEPDKKIPTKAGKKSQESEIADPRNNKESILSRSFAKQKNGDAPRKKSGAVVQSVAIPIEIATRITPEQPSAKAKQIEEERSKRHASIKTTMEIPVFSPSTSEVSLPVAENDLTGDLPADYGETRIVVQVRDPHWAHAYWQIPRSEIKRLERSVGIFEFAHSHFVLRVHNVTDGFTQEFSLSEHARSYYFYLEKASTVYQAELGLQSPSEGYSFIALSNLIQTPADNVASVWAKPVSNYQEENRIAGHEVPAPKDQENEVPDSPSETEEQQQPFSAPAPEITEPSHVFRGVSAESAVSTIAFASQESGKIDMPSLAEEQPGPEVTDVPSSWVAAPAPIGGSFNLPLRNPAEANDEQAKDTDIFLIARPELILYGKVDTRCNLTFNGHSLKYEPDGSFSLRFELPVNERRNLELEAVEPESKKTRSYRATVKFELI